MADVSLKTSFSVTQNGKQILEIPDIRTNAFKKLLVWLWYYRLTPPLREKFQDYNIYVTERFTFAFGTGTTPASENDTDLESPISVSLTPIDRQQLYWYIPKSDPSLAGKYWIPTINENDVEIRLFVDLPGRIFTSAGYGNSITEIGVYVGVPVGIRTYTRKIFTWWWYDYQINEPFKGHEQLREDGLLYTDATATYSGTTYSLTKTYKSQEVELPLPYSRNTAIRLVPTPQYRISYSHSATYNVLYARVLLARIVLDTPLSLQSGFTYSFRYTIYKY